MDDEDATHLSRGLMINNFGKRITHGIYLSSDTDGYGYGHMKHALSMDNVIISTSGSAVLMPQSETNHVGTIIEYDTNDYSYYDRITDRFGFVVGGTVKTFIDSYGLDVNNNKIVNVLNPTDPQDVATKAYVDGGGGGGGGDVVGPGSAINNAISLFSGTSGKLLKDSTRLIEDTLSDGNNLPDGHAIKTYGDANWGGGSTYIYNVKAYGATGNGSTDDTTNIQNAINAAGTAGGGEVYFPPGTYQINSGPLVVDEDYITLRGDPGKKAYLRTSANRVIVKIGTYNYTGSDNFSDSYHVMCPE